MLTRSHFIFVFVRFMYSARADTHLYKHSLLKLREKFSRLYENLISLSFRSGICTKEVVFEFLVVVNFSEFCHYRCNRGCIEHKTVCKNIATHTQMSLFYTTIYCMKLKIYRLC